MASTYSSLKIQLMATGDNNFTWGDVTNQNFLAFQQAITGSADVAFAGADVALTLVDSNALQAARNLRLRATGVMGGATRSLIVPAIQKQYVVQNDTDNSMLVKTPAGAGVTVPAGRRAVLFVNGVDVIETMSWASNFFASSLSGDNIGANGNISAVGNVTGLNGIFSGVVRAGPVGTINLTVEAGVASNIQWDQASFTDSYYYYPTKTINYRIEANTVFVLGPTGNASLPTGYLATTGIKFPAAGAMSSDPNMLDDYEAGNFTPTLKCGGVEITYANRFGRYVKVGRLVTVDIFIYVNTIPGVGAIAIGGLPFTQWNQISSIGSFSQGSTGNALVGFTWPPTVEVFDTAISLLSQTTVLTNANLQPGNIISITATYETAAY